MKQIIAFILLVSGCYGSVEQPVHFRLEKGYLIVAKCSIGDLEDLTAIVDTGVTETVVDSTILQRLRLVAKSDTAIFVAKEAPVQSVLLPSVSFGPIRIISVRAITTDLSGLTRQFGFRPDVLIGMDVLHRSSFTIDYKARVLTFDLNTSFSHAASLLDGGRFVIVEAVVSGQTVRLQLDTGLSGLVVFEDRLRKQLSTGSQAGPATLSGVAASFDTNTISNQQLRVGNWTGYQLPIIVIDRRSQFAEFDGLLGARILTSNRLCLDFTHMMMYWD